MFFDLTKEISLDKKNLRIYAILRIIFYALSGLAATYVAFLVLFPTQYFFYSFLTPNSSGNTVLNPRETNGASLDHGRFPAGKSVFFETPVTENFSSASVNFLLSKKSDTVESGKVTVRKSYQAFFYPEIEYSQDIMPDLYDRKAGLPYQSGTLISDADSIYVVSKDKVFPVDSVETFVALGYKWEDVLRASSDEFSFYEKGPLLNLSSAHPDGTILFDTDSKKHFIVYEGNKMNIHPDTFRDADPRIDPINVSSENASITADCILEKNLSFKGSLSCKISLENFQKVTGKDFQFETIADSEMRVDEIDARFFKDATYENFLLSSSIFYKRIKDNYAPIE